MQNSEIRQFARVATMKHKAANTPRTGSAPGQVKMDPILDVAHLTQVGLPSSVHRQPAAETLAARRLFSTKEHHQTSHRGMNC